MFKAHHDDLHKPQCLADRTAPRFSVLIDAAAFFAAVRKAALRAQRSIVIMGWDLDSRTRLVGESGEAEDGYPIELAPFLSALVAERPDLEVYLLLWDYSLLYATERETFPQLRLQWQTPSRVHFCLDSNIPWGASQHQKIVVVDGRVAFSGGLVLLCHEVRLVLTLRFRMQHGHRGSLFARATAIVVWSVDIEFGVWRSGRSGAARAVALVVCRGFAGERTDEGA